MKIEGRAKNKDTQTNKRTFYRLNAINKSILKGNHVINIAL